MAKKGNEHTLKEVIQQFLKLYSLDDKLNEARIVVKWKEVMGPVIDGHTRNIFLRKATLYVELDNAALKQELSYEKEKLIGLLNEAMGDKVISEVHIK